MLSNRPIKENTRLIPVWTSIFLILLAFLIVGGVFQFIGIVALGLSIDDMAALQKLAVDKHLILQILTTIPIILLVYLFRRFVDRKPFFTLGFSIKSRISDILWGLLVAIGIIGGGTLILKLFGYIEIIPDVFNSRSLFLSFALFIIVSINEEVLVRGYILNNLLSTKLNKYLALSISALIFALLHGLNFNLSWIGMLNLLLAGLVLGAAYIFTQNLWFPISLHLFWNFIQGPVLGYNVSGQGTDSLLKLNQIGSNSINGGDFGFEGSLVCTILTAVTTLIIFIYFNFKIRNQKAKQ